MSDGETIAWTIAAIPMGYALGLLIINAIDIAKHGWNNDQ